ncbi:hypothetical protein FB446DRAFT_789158 [Lentinula raphanica]|nr:hypothetical protein FB446DRAFT_789158 [Lentinula raphanica]
MRPAQGTHSFDIGYDIEVLLRTSGAPGLSLDPFGQYDHGHGVNGLFALQTETNKGQITLESSRIDPSIRTSTSIASALLDAARTRADPLHQTFVFSSFVACINCSLQTQMARTNITSMFFQQITRSPPLIIANRPPPFEAVRMLTLLKALSGHLSGLPSFQSRGIITEPKWPRILLWLVALLKPLDDFIQPDHPAPERYSDMAGRCVVEVFTFLNSIASALTSTHIELENFITRLASSSEMLIAIAKTWVAFFTRNWPVKAHCEVTSFLVLFSRMIGDTAFEQSFLGAVKNVCPNSQLFTAWSAAIAELCAETGVPTANRLIQTANRGLLLAATTTFFRPLPMLDVIHVTLAHMHKLWSQIMTNSFPPGTCYVTMHSLAKFSLLVISGGPNWIAKALDADLLGLLMKTMAWTQRSFSSPPDTAIHDVSEEILHLLLLNTIYKPVRRRILQNLEGLQTQQFEDTLGAGHLKRVWDVLVDEIRSPAARRTSTLCFQRALEKSDMISPAHPNDYSHDDNQGPVDLGDLNRLQLLFHAVILAQRNRDHICRLISNQGLQSSQIVIEINFMFYPSTWKVLDQASSPELQLYLSNNRSFMQVDDTMVAITCPCTASTAVYFARGIHRAILLDPAYDIETNGFGGQVIL